MRITARKYLLEETAEIADDIMSRYGLGVSALNTFSCPRAKSSSLQDELTTILTRIDASLELLTVDRDRCRDRFGRRRRRRKVTAIAIIARRLRKRVRPRLDISRQETGKPVFWPVSAAHDNWIATSCRLLNIKDLMTNWLLLVDTGAEVSVIPE